jgi:hypothetical protein
VTKTRRASPLGLLFFIAALALASSAEAATKSKRQQAARPQASAGTTASCRGANLFPCGPIYSGNDYLGTDPDPFIRLMIQRDLGVKYGGAP